MLFYSFIHIEMEVEKMNLEVALNFLNIPQIAHP